MFDIYEKQIKSAFAGAGVQSLIVKDGIILAHVRGWDNPKVVDNSFEPVLKGQPVNQRGAGWRRLSGTTLDNAQGWARDMAEGA